MAFTMTVTFDPHAIVGRGPDGFAPKKIPGGPRLPLKIQNPH